MLFETYDKCRNLLAFIHIGDYAERQGKILWLPGGGGSRLRADRLERVVLGEGTFGMIAESFIKALKKINYNGFISYEICESRYTKHKLIDFETVEKEASRAVKYLKELIAKV